MKQLATQKLQWIKPAASSNAATAEAKEKAPRLLRAIETLGMPAIAGADTARETAIGLLRVAAEVEHDFIVQYLYAAYSLDDSVGDQVADWRGRLLQTAKEEMGHLITVQNLLLLLGSRIYFERGDFSEHPTLYPFPLALEPLSLKSLAKYIKAESPWTSNKPAGPIHHVGVIYAMLYWLFQKDDQPQGPWELPEGLPFPAGRHIEDNDLLPAVQNQRQTNQGEWNAFGTIFVDPATARDQSLQALFRIARQGEGPVDGEDSHYQDFVAMKREVEEYGSGKFTRDVPINPVTKWSGWPPANSAVTHPQTRLWAQLFDCRYQMLLLEMSLAMAFKSSDVINGRQVRSELAGTWSVFQEMSVTLSNLATLLMTLPKDETPVDGAPKFAGPPFQPPTVALPVEELDLWLRYRALMERSRKLIEQIVPGAQQSLLDFINNTDQGRSVFVQQRIDALIEI